jgi:ABC-type nitrate/sulfonate/bicarbonate transport system substrate-binding protein
MPWTRVVAAAAEGEPLLLVCGSGCEEAAIVVRRGLDVDQVRKVAVPQRGGIKDLTAAGLMGSLGWDKVETIRVPSGDGAILALVGGGADAASMVEPYATLLEELKIGTVVRRTGDLWPGAPGCSLATTAELAEDQPDLVQAMVTAFVGGARAIDADPDRAAEIAARYIAVGSPAIRAALRCNSPDVGALHHQEAMDEVIAFMRDLGYLAGPPSRPYKNLEFLEKVSAVPPPDDGDRPAGRGKRRGGKSMGMPNVRQDVGL